MEQVSYASCYLVCDDIVVAYNGKSEKNSRNEQTVKLAKSGLSSITDFFFKVTISQLGVLKYP